MMPLSMVSPGETVKIATIRAGWGLQRRLADMGLTPGVKVKVIQHHGRGHLVINFRDSKLALGHGVSNKIMVTDGTG